MVLGKLKEEVQQNLSIKFMNLSCYNSIFIIFPCQLCQILEQSMNHCNMIFYFFCLGHVSGFNAKLHVTIESASVLHYIIQI